MRGRCTWGWGLVVWCARASCFYCFWTRDAVWRWRRFHRGRHFGIFFWVEIFENDGFAWLMTVVVIFLIFVNCSGGCFIETGDFWWWLGSWNLIYSVAVCLMEFYLVPVDSPSDVLSKVFWVRVDQSERWSLNELNRWKVDRRGHVTRPHSGDLWAKARSDRFRLKSKVVEPSKSRRLV